MGVPAVAAAELAVSNEQVAAVLSEIADLLEVQGGNAFRIRAYRNAARTVSNLGRSVAALVSAGEDLDELPGIGADLAGKIGEVVARGTCAQLEELRGQTPPGLAELLQLPGLGPKRVQRLYKALGIGSLQQLQAAGQAGQIQTVRGFGPAGQQRLLDAVNQRLQPNLRFPLPAVADTVAVLLAHLKALPGVHEAVPAGSFRRRRDTVGDVDVLVTAADARPVVAALTSYSGVTHVLAGGQTRASVVLANGLQIDLRVMRPISFGAAWLYFTGSRAHGIALRRLAQERGLKLNEYGLYRGRLRIAGGTEASIYAALGLPWIEPELREDRGEIEAARAGTLPQLVQLESLLGDLHVHNGVALGRVGLRALADAAIAHRLRYLAVTDRYRAGGGPGCVDAGGLARQRDAIDELNDGLGAFKFLQGVEAEILEDGRLDLAGADLSHVDLVVGAVDTARDLPPARQTDRLLRAMDHPCFSILAHPGGRLLPQPAHGGFDLERVLRHARERGCFVEANAKPQRLDLDDLGCRMARDAGVLVSISSDAADPAGLADLLWGVGQARRGWLEASDVLNTRPLSEVRRLLAATMGRRAPAKEGPS
jgi:DNA polymerase (family 10)